MKNRKKYDITQCALYKCRSRQRLSKLLMIDYRQMMSKEYISYHSRPKKKKKSNEVRIVTAPDKKLKAIQRRILKLLTHVTRPDWLMSGEKGKCYIDNGLAHINSKFLQTHDIEKFFDKCTREYVYRFFTEKLRTSRDVASLLTDITTHNGKIPTGSPTSMMLAYYAYEDMFAGIIESNKKYDCISTVYVDDITASSQNAFNKSTLSYDISQALNRYGHKLKSKKTRHYTPKKHKLVTGTVVTPNNMLDVPNSLQKDVIRGLLIANRKICKDLSDAEFAQEIDSLCGKIQAARNINPNKYREAQKFVIQLRKEIREKTIKSNP